MYVYIYIYIFTYILYIFVYRIVCIYCMVQDIFSSQQFWPTIFSTHRWNWASGNSSCVWWGFSSQRVDWPFRSLMWELLVLVAILKYHVFFNDISPSKHSKHCKLKSWTNHSGKLSLLSGLRLNLQPTREFKSSTINVVKKESTQY